ncbi:uncharacterized protein LOC128241061 [Mya arenaria]|uniref:uncharacterized protein LOC128241061 n=1 Tax=Mya arenaria TaxID=6604 RepID=UPI0022E48783|nr:uncharacterized protein LOC128241061 [Mya arenaria]
MDRALECPVCLERFTLPKVLPCQHTFCSACLQGVVQGISVRCPECREEHRVPEGGFRTNVAVQRMLDAASEPSDTGRPEPSAPTMSTIEESGPRTAASGDVRDRNEDESCSWPWFKTKFKYCVGWTRQTIRRVLKRFLHDHYREKKTRVLTCALFLTLTLVRFIAGNVKLRSDCGKEQDVAIYLFVKSILGFMFWFAILVLGYKGEITRAIDNVCFEMYIIINTTFAMIWFIVGIVWCFVRYNDMKNECPLQEDGWNFHFINFALFLTAVDCIILMFFSFYATYTICDTSRVGHDASYN